MGRELASVFPVVQCSVKADVSLVSGCLSGAEGGCGGSRLPTHHVLCTQAGVEAA